MEFPCNGTEEERPQRPFRSFTFQTWDKCKAFPFRSSQKYRVPERGTNRSFLSTTVSDSFQERIDVWGWMMWPLWPEGGGSGGQSPEWPEPEGHKGHIMKTQTSILEWKLSLTEWKRWVVWGILTSKILQPKRTIRILPILSPNSETAKDPRMLFSSLLKGLLYFVKMFPQIHQQIFRPQFKLIFLLILICLLK